MDGGMKRIILFLIILFAVSQSASPQLFRRNINQFKNSLRNGLWITYNDTTRKQVEQKGRFKAGREIGTWKYFSDNGTIRKKEKFRKNKILTTTYYPEGMKESSGTALITEEGDELHYYYTGTWKFFRKSGEIDKIVVYDKGKEISSTLVAR